MATLTLHPSIKKDFPKICSTIGKVLFLHIIDILLMQSTLYWRLPLLVISGNQEVHGGQCQEYETESSQHTHIGPHAVETSCGYDVLVAFTL